MNLGDCQQELPAEAHSQGCRSCAVKKAVEKLLKNLRQSDAAVCICYLENCLRQGEIGNAETRAEEGGTDTSRGILSAGWSRLTSSH